MARRILIILLSMSGLSLAKDDLGAAVLILLVAIGAWTLVSIEKVILDGKNEEKLYDKIRTEIRKSKYEE